PVGRRRSPHRTHSDGGCHSSSVEEGRTEEETEMTNEITADRLAAACADDGFDAGIRLVAELEPVGGAFAPVKPAVYDGGRYQTDRRWESKGDAEPAPVVVIDNVPSQANRLEAAV